MSGVDQLIRTSSSYFGNALAVIANAPIALNSVSARRDRRFSQSRRSEVEPCITSRGFSVPSAFDHSQWRVDKYDRTVLLDDLVARSD